MSVEAIAWAFKQYDIDDAQTKLILISLCDHADEDGYCWPSIERLARKSCCSHDTAQRRLRDLEQIGKIQKRRRARKTTIYRICMDKIAMNTQIMRDHDLAPTEAEKDEMLNTQNPLMNTQIDVDEHATAACVTIKGNHQYKPSLELFASDDAKPAKRKKRQPMPEDWEPDERGILFARSLGFAEQRIRQLVMACRDYHLKHGTLIAGSIGLAATWRTWCNNEVKFSAERERRYGKGTYNNRQTRSETILAASRDFAASMARHSGGDEVSERGARSADSFGDGDYPAPDQRH